MSDDFESRVAEACIAELEARGMHRVTDRRVKRVIAPGISGSVGLILDQPRDGHGGSLVAVTPVVGVRHKEACRLAETFLGLQPGQHSQPTLALENLIDDRSAPPDWVVPHESDVAYVARRIADDVVFYGFPYLERLNSSRAIIQELAKPLWKLVGAYVLSVLYMLDGRLTDARATLMNRGRPRTQNPTTWGKGYEQFAAFLDAFSGYFKVDLDVAHWPVLEETPKSGEPTVKIRDPAALRAALSAIGRDDLADRISELAQDQLDEIGARGMAVFRSGGRPDLTTAFGFAAAEFIDLRDSAR